jgi:hypothetical protein
MEMMELQRMHQEVESMERTTMEPPVLGLLHPLQVVEQQPTIHASVAMAGLTVHVPLVAKIVALDVELLTVPSQSPLGTPEDDRVDGRHADQDNMLL